VSAVTLTIAAIALAGAGFATGLTGYGFGLIAMGLLPYVFTVADANAIVSLLAVLTTLVALVPLRSQVTPRLLRPLLAGAIIGVPLGVVYLVRVDERILRLSLGVIILLALGASLYAGRRAVRRRAAGSPQEPAAGPVGGDQRSPGRVLPFGIGIVSGSLGGAFSVSGPPVVMYFSEAIDDKHSVKANLLAYFTFVIAIRIPFLAASGVVTADLLRTAALMLPAVALGLWAGTLLHNRLPARAVRVVIQAMLALSAILMIAGS
jgi:uncharacterized membrane protein YfcA